MASSAAQVGSILQPLVSHENPPTYFKTNKFTNSFQVRVGAWCVHWGFGKGFGKGRWGAAVDTGPN